MKKMTKLAVTVAAMSAMTIAAATMVSADGKYNSIANEKPATGISDGEWGGNSTDGWTFTVDGKKVTQWNEIDGVWYYFHKDGIMACEELLYLNGHTYYFNTDGSMMANGWVGFDDESEILYDYDLDVQENIDDIQNKVFKNEEDAYDTVWMYFNGNGTAKDDEWYQADSGLWYYFDDIIMACGDFDHEIGNNRYGFDENGAMLVGWARNYVDEGITAPNKDDNTWYYYESSGKKFDANDNNGYGWKKIDGKWYCFEVVNGGTHADSVGTLIVNSFFYNDVVAAGNEDYYYVDKDGVMATGVVSVDKDAVFVDGTKTWSDEFKIKEMTDGKNWDVFFDNGNGKAKGNAWSGNRFYASAYTSSVTLFEETGGSFVTTTYSTTGYTKDDVASEIKGALVKEAFVAKDDNLYYVDKYGDKVTSSALQVGTVDVTLDADGKVTGYTFHKDNNSGQYRAYVVFDGKGIAYTDIDKDRTVKAGAKKYISLDNSNAYQEATENVTLFFYKNNN